MEIPTITTARLDLRPFTADDAEPLHRILAKDGVLQYFPNTTPPSLEQTRKFIAGQLKHWEERGFGWWAVEPRAGGAMIGWNGLQYLPETNEIEIGFLLDKAHWGQGLTTEGARAGLQFGFDGLGLETIIAVVHPENIASQRVIEKLDMAFTGQTEYFGMEVYRYVLSALSFKQGATG